jgi:hypothetical protein
MGTSTGGAPVRGAPPSQAAEYLRILVTLSRRLAESPLDFEVILDAVAAHVVEALGDGCAAYLVTKDDMWLEAVTIRHRDPARRAVRR